MEKGTIATTDYRKIKKLIQEHEGKPTVVGNPDFESNVGLRVQFPNSNDSEYLSRPINKVSWDYFFKVFEDKQLAFIYEEQPEFRDLSLAYKFINRNFIISSTS